VTGLAKIGQNPRGRCGQAAGSEQCSWFGGPGGQAQWRLVNLCCSQHSSVIRCLAGGRLVFSVLCKPPLFWGILHRLHIETQNKQNKQNKKHTVIGGGTVVVLDRGQDLGGTCSWLGGPWVSVKHDQFSHFSNLGFRDGLRAVRYMTWHAYFKTLHEFQSRKLYTPLYITLLYIKLYAARGGAHFIFSLIRETGKTLDRRWPMARKQAPGPNYNSSTRWALQNRCSLWQPLWLQDHHWCLSLPLVKWMIAALHVIRPLKLYILSSFYIAKRLFGYRYEFLKWENLVWPPSLLFKQTNPASVVVKWMESPTSCSHPTSLHVFRTLKLNMFSSFYTAKRLFGHRYGFLKWENLVWPPSLLAMVRVFFERIIESNIMLGWSNIAGFCQKISNKI
jgi:hypothetical protein